MKKKCTNCWSYIEQQEWKTEEEKQMCLLCTMVVNGLKAFCEVAVKMSPKRDIIIRWEWKKKK